MGAGADGGEKSLVAHCRFLPGAKANQPVEIGWADAGNQKLGKAMVGFPNLRKGMLEVDAGFALSEVRQVLFV